MNKKSLSFLILFSIIGAVLLFVVKFYVYDPLQKQKRKARLVKKIRHYFNDQAYDTALHMIQCLLYDHAEDQELITLLNNILMAKKELAYREEQDRFSNLAQMILNHSHLVEARNKKYLTSLNRGLTQELRKLYSPGQIRLDNKELEKLIRQGIEYFNQGRLLEAKKMFLEVLKLDQKNSYANAYFGAILYQENPIDQHRVDQAVQKCTQAIEQDNSIEIAHYVLAQIYEKRRLYDSALTAYTRTLEINPENYLAYFRMGMIYASQQQFDLSAQYLRHAIEVNREFIDGYFFLAETEARLKNYSRALDCLDRVLALNPDFDKAYLKKAEIYRLQKEYKPAAALIEKAIALNPYYEYYFKLADSYEKLHHSDKACLAYGQSIKKNELSNEKERLYLLSAYKKIISLKIKSGRKAEALAYANEGLKQLGPGTLELYLLAADLKFDLKFFKKAALDYQTILSLVETTADHYQFYYKLGQCALESGDWQEAENYFSRVIESNQDYYPAYEALVKLLVNQKNYFKAKKLIARYSDDQLINKSEKTALLILVQQKQKVKL